VAWRGGPAATRFAAWTVTSSRAATESAHRCQNGRTRYRPGWVTGRFVLGDKIDINRAIRCAEVGPSVPKV
jgi:hypothetical protein